MTEQEFRAVYPLLFGWIQKTLAQSGTAARLVSSLGFRRLPGYYGDGILSRAKVVVVPKVPVPSLSAMGLSRFSEFERLDMSGITYLDTYFVRANHAGFESLHSTNWFTSSSGERLVPNASSLFTRTGWNGLAIEAAHSK